MNIIVCIICIDDVHGFGIFQLEKQQSVTESCDDNDELIVTQIIDDDDGGDDDDDDDDD